MPGNVPATTSPPDLDVRVRERRLGRDSMLEYHLSSPSGIVSFDHAEICSEPLRRIEAVKHALFQRLARLDLITDEKERKRHAHLLRADVAGLGRWLYDNLFSVKLRAAYLEFRDQVKTLRIVSDDDWIPWELIKAYDGGHEDEFFGLQFQLTRWLPGRVRPAECIVISRIGCVIASDAVFHEGKAERMFLAELAGNANNIEFEAPTPASWESVETLLKTQELNLLHLTGHGMFDSANPAAATIPLAGHCLSVDHLSGTVAERIALGRPLVFLNACHAGRQGWALTKLEGWAAAWIHNCRVGAFVSPLSAVRDSSSRRFSEVFYKQLADGVTIGAATQNARLRLVAENDADLLDALSYAVYAHPNARVVFGKVAPAEAPTGLGTHVGTTAEVRRQVRDCRRLIVEKTTGFVGRSWIFEQVEQFLSEKSRGYFIIRGDPGCGKSSLAAELVRRHSYFHHFNVCAEGITEPAQFLSNVCAQLIAHYGLVYSFLPPEATQDARFFMGLLERVAANRRGSEKIVIVVDALNEVDPAGYREGVNPLYLPTAVPEGVYFIVTSQRGLPKLSITCEMQVLELRQDDAENIADINELIESWLNRPGILIFIENNSLTKEYFVNDLLAKSQGNFMYLHYVLPEIETGKWHDDTRLPNGLENYYETPWLRMRSRNQVRWLSYQIPTLVALTVLPEPVAIDLLTEFSGIRGRRRVLDVLEEWEPFIYSIEVANRDGQRQRRFRLFHTSFQEFIARKNQIFYERMRMGEAHQKIANTWRKQIDEEKTLASPER